MIPACLAVVVWIFLMEQCHCKIVVKSHRWILGRRPEKETERRLWLSKSCAFCLREKLGWNGRQMLSESSVMTRLNKYTVWSFQVFQWKQNNHRAIMFLINTCPNSTICRTLVVSSTSLLWAEQLGCTTFLVLRKEWTVWEGKCPWCC